MEQWEALVKSYPPGASQGDLRKAINSANVVLKEDLAPFEIDWLLQTLISEPVNLLSSLSQHSNDNTWTSIIGLAFDLLSTIFTSNASYMQQYVDDVVKVCQQNYSALNRKRALTTLYNACKHNVWSPLWAGIVGSAATALGGDDAVLAKSARARLVGAICEHQPDVLTDGQEIQLWRTFLSVLEGSKVTDSLVNGVLQGICGLFKNFGMNIPVAEICGIFYEKLARNYVAIGSCEEICLEILTKYCHLFPEKLSADAVLRKFLWTLLQNGSKAGDTLLAVHGVAISEANVQEIVTAEIYPRINSKNPLERSVACRILSAILNKYANQMPEILREFDKQASNTCAKLDTLLNMRVDTMTDKSEYDHDLMNLLEEAAWCVEARVPGCDVLLRSVLLLHHTVPRTRRRRLLVHVLLKAEPGLRTAAITFLLAESIQPGTGIDTFMSIWEEMFDTKLDTDEIVDRARPSVVQDVVGYLVKMLNAGLEEVPSEKSIEKLSNLLKLSSHLLSMDNFSCHLPSGCPAAILDQLTDAWLVMGPSEGLVLAVAALLRVVRSCDEEVDLRLVELVGSLKRHSSEPIRCAFCVAALEIPSELFKKDCDVGILLEALQVILTRNDVENETLIKAVLKLEELLTMKGGHFVDSEIEEALISNVEKLKRRKSFIGKTGRVLERHVVLFLGKYGNRVSKVTRDDSQVTVKDVLTLNIPNLSDGTTLKLNISTIYDLALEHEDPEVLNALLLILSAYLSDKPDSLLQRALTAVIIKLSVCHSRMEGRGGAGGLLTAVALCDRERCGPELFECITMETSPGPRKILSSLLTHLLTLDPHSEATETAISLVMEKTLVLIKSGAENEQKSALDFVESLLECLKDNNELFKQFAPELFVAILKSTDHVALKLFTGIFLEKICIFERKSLEDMLQEVYRFLNKNSECSEDLLKVIFSIFKGLYEILDLHEKHFLRPVSKTLNSKLLMILTVAKATFDYNAEQCRFVINCMHEDSWKYSLYSPKTVDPIKILLSFIQSYAEILLELQYKETLNFLGEAIEAMTTKQAKFLHGHLKSCIDDIKRINVQTPQILMKHISNWVLKIPVQDLTRNLKMEYITSKDELTICALSKMFTFLNADKIKSIPADGFKEWMEILLKMHSDESAILKTKMAALNDVLAVTLLFLNAMEVKELCQNSLPFVRFFIGPFSFYLMDNVFENLDSQVVALLYNDILGYYSREKCSKDDLSRILRCLMQIWPCLEKDLTFEEVHAILLRMSRINDLSIDEECQPLTWWLKQMETTDKDRKMQLVQVLPLFAQGGSEHYKDLFVEPIRSLFDVLPLRMTSRADPAAILTALAALAACAQETLAWQAFNTLTEEDLPAWLEASVHHCVKSLAARQDGEVLLMIYAICTENDLSVCLLERTLGTVIRYSSQQVCQAFLASVIPRILAQLWRTQRASESVAYTMYLVQTARALTLARWVFEKMPLQALESTDSPLYNHIDLRRSKNLAQELCKLCVTLRREVTGGGGDAQMQKCFRYFQTSNYNCLAAVLLKTKPQVKFFEQLFKIETWPLLIDCNKNIVVYIEGIGRSQLKRHHVPSSDATSPPPAAPHTATHTATAPHTPTFTRRTLSDNPFMYDLMEDAEVDQCESQAILLSDNELNNHPCATTLCAVIKHLSTADQGPLNWLNQLVAALAGGAVNVKWFLAQAIINCKEEVKKHASALAPALLAVVAETPYKQDGKCLLNGLHVNIIHTIQYWHGLNPIKNDSALETNVNLIVQSLINSCIYHKQRNSVLKTLTASLSVIVEMYGEVIKIDWLHIEEILKDQTNEAPIYEILDIATKKNLHIPELIPALVTKLETQTSRHTNIAKLLGLALSNCHDLTVKTTALSKLYRQLDRMRGGNSQDYVKVMFYAQAGCAEVCNEMQFRHITDLAPKMVREQRTKCLKIISNYISKYTETNEYITAMFETIDICDAIISDDTNAALGIAACGLTLMSDTLKRRVVHLTCSYCGSSTVATRLAAFAVILRAAEEFLTEPGESPAKRLKTEPASRMLSVLHSEDVYKSAVLARVGAGAADGDAPVRTTVLDRACALLEARDMGVRFLESILICVHLTSTVLTGKSVRLSAPQCLTAALTMFLRGYSGQPGFGALRLREEPISISPNQEDLEPPTLLTTLSAFQGTFRSGRARPTRTADKPGLTKPGLDVQIPIKELIDIFLRFCQNNREAATSLFLETLKQFQGCAPVGAQAARLLSSVLSNGLTDLTPCVVEACRVCVDKCCLEPGFERVLRKLKQTTRRTEGYELVKLLYEDVLLRNVDENTFVLGKWITEEADAEMAEPSKDFSMDAMLDCFGKLSDWDELTIQEKRKITNDGLPVLWTDEQTCRQALEVATDLPPWLSALRVRAHTDACDRYVELRRLGAAWPRTHFAISCMSEAIQWRGLEEAADWGKVPSDIKPADCMAEWAARLMARSCIASDMEKNDINGCSKQIRYQQLAWCSEARARGLSCLVPQCTQISIPHLTEGEIRPWLYQQCLMLQSQGLIEKNEEMLKKALDKLENIAPNHGSASDELLILELGLKLGLRRDLNTLSKETVATYTREAFKEIHPEISETTKKNISSVLEMCMVFLNDTWDDKEMKNQAEDLSSMATFLSQLNNLNIKSDMAVCILLTRLNQYDGTISAGLTEEILRALSPLADDLDDLTVDQLISARHKLDSTTFSKFPRMLALIRRDLLNEKMARCLQLVCDVDHALMQACEGLLRAVNKCDESKWNERFTNMKTLIYENEYAGAAYHMLHKYKMALYAIATFEPTEIFKLKAIVVLERVHAELQSKPTKTCINMMDVCPSLSRRISEEDGKSLARILRLPPGVYVVGFQKNVHSFKSSLMRPCVVRALLSSGYGQRFIVKRGEPLRADAAAARCVAALNRYSRYKNRGYWVVPLSVDCGVLQYLGKHVTLRSMLSDDYDLNAITSSVRRPAAGALAAAPRAASLAQYHDLCGRVPAYALRSALEDSCSSIQEFISKKRSFQDSLAAMAIFHSVLGLGDRHLENLMVSAGDGAASAVDLAAALQLGGEELPPARLTRLLLAVCDTEVLESRMQSVLQSLRQNYKVLWPILQFSFKWMRGYGTEVFEKKTAYMQDLLQGKALSFQITKKVLTDVEAKHLENYCALLDEVFEEFPTKELYEIEEQISSLLLQCTDPRILCITRRGWEPWL